MEAEGGKQLFNAEAGVWFKELKQSRGSDSILNRTIVSETHLRLRNSVLDRKLQRVILIDYSSVHPFYMLNTLINHLIAYSS